MKRFKTYLQSSLFLFLLLFQLYACKEEIDETIALPDKNIYDLDNNDISLISKALAKAIKDEDVRVFLKEEALKEIGGENDVLISLSKNKIVSNGKTLNQVLAENSNSLVIAISTILSKYPLLTINIPILNSFSCSNWKTENQIPLVAFFSIEKDKVIYVNHLGNMAQESAELKPDFPVILLKINENVFLKRDIDEALLTGNDFQEFVTDEFSFIHPASASVISSELASQRAGNTSTYDSRIVQAYEKGKNCSSCYHKDYIYYNISPSEGINSGPFNGNYVEAITSVTFENTAVLEDVSSNWTEGVIDFRFDFYFIGGDSEIDGLAKQLKVRPEDVMDIEYETICTSIFPGWGLSCFQRVKSRTLKTYALSRPIILAPWEMDKYGDRWLIKISEFDQSETYTENVSLSTTKGTNFSINASTGEKVKLGANFGATNTTTSTRTKQVTYQIESDQLGEIIHDWKAPVISNRLVLTINVPFIGPRTSDISTSYLQSTGSVLLAIETIRTNR